MARIERLFQNMLFILALYLDLSARHLIGRCYHGMHWPAVVF